ncbi:DUF2469 domain-containing protein [Micrococcoides hystricis]|uniref:DUF2469 domain-containing protein n=1 Tax=Micrococcoides hystricis TaxID=1572761 RepID=A0ABV6PE87_9MICC
MSAEELEQYEAEIELGLYREYRDVISLFKYVVETERRFYLANQVSVETKTQGQSTYFQVDLVDAWVWDIYRTSRFVKNVSVRTFADVNVEELVHANLPDHIGPNN